MIKAIVFDLGNVTLTSDYAYNTPHELLEFCEYFGVTMDNLGTAFAEHFPPYALGDISEDEYWKKFLHTARATKNDVSHAKKFYRQYQKENDQMLTLLQRLKKKYRLAALTTIPREWLDFKTEKFGLNKYFETIVSSGYSGMTKPNQRVYELVLKKLQLPGPEVLFIDDRKTLLQPAEKLGMLTHVFRGRKELENYLSKQKLL